MVVGLIEKCSKFGVQLRSNPQASFRDKTRILIEVFYSSYLADTFMSVTDFLFY